MALPLSATSVATRRPCPPDGREFIDSLGAVWCVFQREEQGGELRLVFDSTTAFRKVRAYPANWRSLDATALERLSWGT